MKPCPRRWSWRLAAALSRALSAFVLLAIAWVSVPASADTIETRPNRVTVQRLLDLCRGTPPVGGGPLSEANEAGCVGYARGVADVLKDTGAISACPIASAVEDVVGKISNRKVRYANAENGMASELVSLMLVKSCSEKTRP
jgi:hypothetical protein